MRTSNWIILFVIIFLALFIPFEFSTEMVEKETKESLTLESYCISSGQAALSEADFSTDEIYHSKEIKEAVINQFYDIYAQNCNYTGPNAIYDAKNHIPCIILTDWDGYYVQYTQWYKKGDQTMYTDILSEKSKWSEMYGKFMVTYRLDDVVNVTDTSVSPDVYFTGSYNEVYEQIKAKYNSNDMNALEFLSNADKFETERNNVIVTAIDKSAQYYINTHNEFFNTKHKEYTLNLPSSKDDQFASLLDLPCIISFVQGKQKSFTNGEANIYTYGAADMTESNIYYVSKDETGYLSYHKENCPNRGETIFFGTMDECAKHGANPCDCVRSR